MQNRANQPSEAYDDSGFLRLNDNAKNIIADLREEVASQKECITKFTIQSLGFVGVVWGLVFKFNGFGIPFYICNALLVYMLLIIVRLANHKYATINRNLGYQLHLSRLKDYASVGNPKWAQKMMAVDWEEAMCAWRFVQPSLFEAIYESTTDTFYDSLRAYRRKISQEDKDAYYWYETEALIAKGGAYHQGKYLRNIHRFLNTVAVFSLVIMISFLIYQIFLLFMIRDDLKLLTIITEGAKLGFVAALWCLLTKYSLAQIKRQSNEREILEGGILSIQSCAVVWRIVVTCHILGSFWPLTSTDKDGKKTGSYRLYTTFTSAMGLDFINNHFNTPHEWLSKWEHLWGHDKKLRDALQPVLGSTERPAFQRNNLKPKNEQSWGEVVHAIIKLIASKN